MSGFVKKLSNTAQNSLKWPLDWINQNLWRKVVRRTTTITIYFWVSVVSSINLYKRRQTDDMTINLVHQRIRLATEKNETSRDHHCRHHRTRCCQGMFDFCLIFQCKFWIFFVKLKNSVGRVMFKITTTWPMKPCGMHATPMAPRQRALVKRLHALPLSVKAIRRKLPWFKWVANRSKRANRTNCECPIFVDN